MDSQNGLENVTRISNAEVARLVREAELMRSRAIGDALVRLAHRIGALFRDPPVVAQQKRELATRLRHGALPALDRVGAGGAP